MHRIVRNVSPIFLLGCGETAPAALEATHDLVSEATATGHAPELAYACDIWEPQYAGPALEAQPERAAYGTLSVHGDRYELVLADGQSTQGTLSVGPGGTLSWTGDLGSIDDAPRHVTRARLTAYDDVANLAFDFEPPTEGPVPHRQVICRATVAAARQ